MSEKKELNQIQYEKKTVYEKAGKEIVNKAYDYANGYKAFLDAAKTEREAVEYGVQLAEEKGYVAYDFGDPLTTGGKYYYNNRGKNLFLFRIGSESLENGIRITAAHLDSPRLDLKQVPVYEDGGIRQ